MYFSNPFLKLLESFLDKLSENEFLIKLFDRGLSTWEVIGIIAGIIVLWIILDIIFGKKMAWEHKDPEKAMKALNELDELDYLMLKAVEEKSPLPEVRQAAREKNRLGHSVREALQNPGGSRRFAEPETLDFYSAKSGQTESGKLVVFTKGYGGSVYLHRVTYCLPADIKPSCPEAAEYRLELNYDENVVGSYTDGSSAVQSHVKGKLSRRSKPVWEDSAGGSAPPSEKYWSGRNAAGSIADATPIVMRAIRTVRNDRKSAK